MVDGGSWMDGALTDNGQRTNPIGCATMGSMPRRVLVAAACILSGSLLWTARLLFGSSPWGANSSALLALGLLVATSVSLVALLLSPGRWVRNAIAVTAGAWALTAIALEADLLWIAALAILAAGAVLTRTSAMDSWFQQVKADRVPTKATVLAFGQVCWPAVVGGLGIPDVTPAGWVLAVFGLVGGWAYARALPGSLWTLRLVLLPLGIAAGPGLRPAAAAALVAVALALTLLSWTAEARFAVDSSRPRRVRPVSILPEVTPPGLMESAGYDRRGRPLAGSD